MLKESVTINHDEILLFIHRKSQNKSYWHFKLSPFKKLCLLTLLSPWHQHVLQSIGGRTQWLSCPCSSTTTQKNAKCSQCSDPIQVANKKVKFCSFLSYVEEQPVVGHWGWHIEDLVIFSRDCGTWNFHHEKNCLPKMHTAEKQALTGAGRGTYRLLLWKTKGEDA